ncbi:MAG: HNH endonuclease [Rhodospirillaceae bacterium]|jgi:5-methylcytosine-specific restriction endonuclease McrA
MSKTKHGRRHSVGGRQLRGWAARALVRARDGDVCHLCGELVHEGFEQGDPEQATLDHLTERAAGGDSDIANMRLAHRSCNEQRGQEFDRLRRDGTALATLIARVCGMLEQAQGPFVIASIDQRASR